jgi:hypothetical protein
MPTLPYKVISWNPYELITEDKMNQDAYNVHWLYENTPRVIYTSPSVNRTQGIKIACGRVEFTKKNDDEDERNISFGGFFSNGCHPVVTVSVTSPGQRKIFAVTSGLNQLHPNENGFKIKIEVAAQANKVDKIKKAFWVHWIAMGY